MSELVHGLEPDRDGRNIDPGRGKLEGEGAELQVGTTAEAWPRPVIAAGPTPTYYDMPALKGPPWKWYVPAYFYAGGVAGAAATLAAAMTLAPRGRWRDLAVKLRWISAVGDTVGA